MSWQLVRTYGGGALASVAAVLAGNILLSGPDHPWKRFAVAGLAAVAFCGWRVAQRQRDLSMVLLGRAENELARMRDERADRFRRSLSARPVQLTETTNDSGDSAGSACCCGPDESGDPVIVSVPLLTEQTCTTGRGTTRRLSVSMPAGAAWHTAN